MEEELDNFERKQQELMETYRAQLDELELQNKFFYEENQAEDSFFLDEK